MGGQHPELAVDRQDGLWPDQPEQRAQLLGARVAGHVHRGVLLVQHLGPVPRQPVDRVVDAQLVPGDRPGRDDHGVAPLDVNGRVVVVRDPRQRRERLALRARAEHELFVRRDIVEIGGPNELVVVDLDVAEVPRHVQVAPHRSSHHGDAPAAIDRDVDRLLHPVDVRREARDENAALSRGDDLAECLADDTFGAGEPGTLRVRRVGAEKIDAAVPELGQLPDVGSQPVDGRVVELPVAGVEDAARLRLDRDADGVRHRVGHAHELEPERSQLERCALRVDLA